MNIGSVSASSSVATTPTCTNRKSKGASKNSNNKPNEKQHLTVNVCFLQPLLFLIVREKYISFTILQFSFLNFQYSNHESKPSNTITKYNVSSVQNNSIEVEPSPSASSNNNNNSDNGNSIDPKLGWTTMTSQVWIMFYFYGKFTMIP